MRELYNRLLKLLDEVDFDNIWHGFHEFEFALYNDETVYMCDKEIPYDDRFLRNTAIEFDGKNIAIWRIDDISTVDEEELVSNLVHEMFHAFQREIGETRFKRDLVTLSYSMDTKNFELKHAENVRLANAYDETKLSTKMNLLKEFISIRRQREKLIGSMVLV